MKANEKQREICSLIREQAFFWENCNDIGSSTLYCDNEESVGNLDIKISDDDKEDLTNFLDNLLNFIKEIK